MSWSNKTKLPCQKIRNRWQDILCVQIQRKPSYTEHMNTRKGAADPKFIEYWVVSDRFDQGMIRAAGTAWFSHHFWMILQTNLSYNKMILKWDFGSQVILECTAAVVLILECTAVVVYGLVEKKSQNLLLIFPNIVSTSIILMELYLLSSSVSSQESLPEERIT